MHGTDLKCPLCRRPFGQSSMARLFVDFADPNAEHVAPAATAPPEHPGRWRTKKRRTEPEVPVRPPPANFAFARVSPPRQPHENQHRTNNSDVRAATAPQRSHWPAAPERQFDWPPAAQPTRQAQQGNRMHNIDSSLHYRSDRRPSPAARVPVPAAFQPAFARSTPSETPDETEAVLSDLLVPFLCELFRVQHSETRPQMRRYRVPDEPVTVSSSARWLQ